jgi:uracil-DNA glycosylase
MTIYPFNFRNVHTSWYECLQTALTKLDPGYLEHLTCSKNWLPGHHNIFNAFSVPLNQINYVLFGESPYPRHESANGYAFWDAAVNELWSPTGLNKKVNRATSLRNIIKMLLIAEGLLNFEHYAQEDIARIDKTFLIQTNNELFTRLLRQGFLLLNATLVLQPGPPQRDARAWAPFIQYVLDYLIKNKPDVFFILLGGIAVTLDQFIQYYPKVKKIYAEHPYNLSFIKNHTIIDFFKPLHLLYKN